MILITGAAGKTGLTVIRGLKEKGTPVRGLIHQDSYSDVVMSAGAEEIMHGNLLNKKDVQRAMTGIRAVYHIPPNVHPREVEIGEIVLSSAKEAGVEHFVYHSVLHPQIEAMPHHWLKLRVEERLIASGLSFTILQPTAYMQNITSQLERIKESGIYQVPYPPETNLCLVDLADVAKVASIVLEDTTHDGAIYQLVGTGLTSQVEVAALISKLLEQEIRVEQISLDDWKEQVERTGLGSYQISALVKMFLHYQAHGFFGSPRMLSWILGHQPTSLEECLQREISRLNQA